jgi:hypothetical protein
MKTRFKEFLNENINYSNIEDDIQTLFNRYDRELSKEKTSVKGLRESLEMIDGDAEITEKSEYSFKGDRLIYKEMLSNDTLILVIHAAYTKSTYGREYGYRYEIGLYQNDPSSYQIGGGYGASGIVGINHTKLIIFSDYNGVHYNKEIISKVIDFIKKKINDPKYIMNNNKVYSIGDKVFTKEWGEDKSNGYRYRRNGELIDMDIENDKYILKMRDNGQIKTYSLDDIT